MNCKYCWKEFYNPYINTEYCCKYCEGVCEGTYAPYWKSAMEELKDMFWMNNK